MSDLQIFVFIHNLFDNNGNNNINDNILGGPVPPQPQPTTTTAAGAIPAQPTNLGNIHNYE